MTQILRGMMLSVALATAGFATTINFSGTGVFGTDDFSGVTSATTFTGSLTVESAGPDQDVDEPNNNGSYSLLVGQLQLSVLGFGDFTFIPSEFFPVTVRTSNLDEGTDVVEVESTFGPLQILVAFYGDNTGNFVTAPAGVNGLDAVNGINWANFAGGNVSLTSGSLNIASQTAGAVELPVGFASFAIENASNVPEPGTGLVIVAGLAAIWMKRRSV